MKNENENENENKNENKNDQSSIFNLLTKLFLFLSKILVLFLLIFQECKKLLFLYLQLLLLFTSKNILLNCA